ncbi:hypothetical protein DPMN_046054 [Dreissena polymorpha]|uniref:C2H2-type domain-containing protein n=1 Tax=Dreissena polymorpha TaxID=45954 RepID=A0A9D4I0I1_DREPO|nr:hypothetical protein DPMN_046054 [Dreissena polymorpha]
MEGIAVQTAKSFLPLTLKASFEIVPNYSYVPSQQYSTVQSDEKPTSPCKYQRQLNITHCDISSTPSSKRLMSQNENRFQDDLPPRQAEDTRDAMTFKELESCDEEPIEVLKKCFVDLSTKDGHLCVYCGKLYSRKYGLKIHLRTHTGYKPLRCKYCFRAFGDPSNLNKHIRCILRVWRRIDVNCVIKFSLADEIWRDICNRGIRMNVNVNLM